MTPERHTSACGKDQNTHCCPWEQPYSISQAPWPAWGGPRAPRHGRRVLQNAFHVGCPAQPRLPHEYGGQSSVLEQRKKARQWQGIAVQIKAGAHSTARTSTEVDTSPTQEMWRRAGPGPRSGRVTAKRAAGSTGNAAARTRRAQEKKNKTL